MVLLVAKDQIKCFLWENQLNDVCAVFMLQHEVSKQWHGRDTPAVTTLQ